jgi:hypothetical protein
MPEVFVDENLDVATARRLEEGMRYTSVAV